MKVVFGLKGEPYINERGLQLHYREKVKDLLDIYESLLVDIPDNPEVLNSFKTVIDYIGGNTYNEDLFENNPNME